MITMRARTHTFSLDKVYNEEEITRDNKYTPGREEFSILVPN